MDSNLPKVSILIPFFCVERYIPLSYSSSKQGTLIGLLSFSVPSMLWGRLIRASLYKEHNIEALDGVNYRDDTQVITRLMYYADAVAALDKVVYHYDRSNENSYMSQGWKSLNVKLEKDEQDIIAVKWSGIIS